MAKKQGELTSDQIIDSTIDAINKKAKHRVIARAGDVPNPFFLRRPSGIMQLDIDTGGGLPAGGWSLISGPEGAGKTYLLSKYMAYQQKIYGADSRVALATVEFLPDHFYLRECGLQVEIPDAMIEERNEWRRSRGMPLFTKDEIKEFKRQIGRVDIITGATGEETLEGVLALYGSKQYNIIGLDSISVMEAKADEGKDLDDGAAQAAAANLLTKFTKKYHPLTLGLDDDNNLTTLIFISQVRDNKKKSEVNPNIAKYIREWAATGARSMRHGKLIDITVWPGEKVKEGTKEAKIQTGKMIMWEITKGKVGTHDGIRGEVEYDYVGKVDDAQTVFEAGCQFGIIVERGNGFLIQQAGTHQLLLPSHSRKGLLERLATDFGLQHRVRIEILAAKGIQCKYR
jgi:RecA/RadA recombinase